MNSSHEIPSCNNEVFVACGAQEMKTQLNAISRIALDNELENRKLIKNNNNRSERGIKQ